MAPDSMLVDAALLARIEDDVTRRSPAVILEELREQEPALADHIEEKLAALVGRLTLSDMPSRFARRIHEEALAVVVAGIQSVRRGYYDLWKDTNLGSRLPEPTPPPKKRRRRSEPPRDDDIPF